MAGTVTGGKRAAATNKRRYGDNFYRSIGKAGGTKSRNGGFAKDRNLASEAGRLGGSISRRKRKVKLADYPLEYDES